MKIQATCPACQATIVVAAEHAGKRARCPKCGGVISIPGAAPSQSPPASPGKSPSRSGASSGSPRGTESESPPRRARRANEGDDEGERSPEKDRVAPRRRRKEPAADDLWGQPLSSYSSPAIEEEHYEAFGIAGNRGQSRGKTNPRTGKREGGNQGGYTAPGYKIPLIMAAIGLGSAILFGGIGLAFPPVAIVGITIGGTIGFIMLFWGGLRVLLNAFEVDVLTGILYILFWPYALYFLFSRWEINKHPFLIHLMGILVFFTSCLSYLIPNFAFRSN